MMDAIKVTKKNNRQNSAGSLKIQIPIITVPTAPIPVQTAYAVPKGSDLVACIKRTILMTKQIPNPANQRLDSVPEVALDLPKQAVKPTSKIPAMININQLIVFILKFNYFTIDLKNP